MKNRKEKIQKRKMTKNKKNWKKCTMRIEENQRERCGKKQNIYVSFYKKKWVNSGRKKWDENYLTPRSDKLIFLCHDFSVVLFFVTEHSLNILEVFMGDPVNKIWSAEHSLRKLFFLRKHRKVLLYFIFILFFYFCESNNASCILCTVLTCPLSPFPFFIYPISIWIFIMSQITHLQKIKIVVMKNIFSNYFYFLSKFEN